MTVCAGLCSQCGEAEAVPGRKLCSGCLAYLRIFRQQRRDAGLCPMCGREPRPGKKTCQVCADKQAALYRARRDRRRAAGECYSCGAPADGFRCPRCAERVARSFQKWKVRQAAGPVATVTTTILCLVEGCRNPPQPGRSECAGCIAARLAEQQPAQNEQAGLEAD